MNTPASRPAFKWIEPVGPKLRMLVHVLFVFFALVGANSLYLSSITFLEWKSKQTYQDHFYQWMFLGHLSLGLLMLLPLALFLGIHLRNVWRNPNRRAVRAGFGLLVPTLLLPISGLILVAGGSYTLKQPVIRSTVYWVHVLSPLAVIWLYWLHRLAGPKINYKLGAKYLGATGVLVVSMVYLQTQDPREWHVVGPAQGEQYFEPSLARTANGKFIPADVLDMNQYCLKCHKDAHDGWKESVHHNGSFNNPAYLATIRETRKHLMERDGNVQGARFCAACHDPVPFFSGAFDDPEFDDVNHPTAKSGITCTACHGITNINSRSGNGAYTIEEPLHYPFASSDNKFLQWVNGVLVKAKPSFHKKTFLKDFHKTSEFCSVCHKVHIPEAFNDYKFLRGQNHFDSFELSGVSGKGASSFYYPEIAHLNCNGCHMPLQESNDFGAKIREGSDKPTIHDHLFPGANTAIAHWRNRDDIVKKHQKFLKDSVRLDIFGLREGDSIEGDLIAPLRPELPTLKPGQNYVMDVVIRTMKLGHLLTQGTADSNELWLDVTVKSGDRVIGRNGKIDEEGRVDEWSHFINAFVVDRQGKQIDRRNVEDIFVPIYNHQIPPGAADSLHYGFTVPDDLTEPVTVTVKLQYRKFNKTYVDFLAKNLGKDDPPLGDHKPGEPYEMDLPVTTLATDEITLPVEGIPLPESLTTQTSEIPLWQRWNDYGIGLLLKGPAISTTELKQAAEAFRKVEKLGRVDGPMNLARVYLREGRVGRPNDAADQQGADNATKALNRAGDSDQYEAPAPPWTLAWLSGLVNRQQGRFTEAEENFRSILERNDTPERIRRRFDFSQDYRIINLLGETLHDRARQIRVEVKDRAKERESLLWLAVEQYKKTLALDPENVTAHDGLARVYADLKEVEKSQHHRKLQLKYKADDAAQGLVSDAVRQRYPAVKHVTSGVVVYPLQDRPDVEDEKKTAGE